MTGTEGLPRTVEGYDAPVKQALWMRVCTYGVPRTWAALWVCACLYLALMTMVLLGVKWLLVPALLWLAGHGVLMALTLFDTHWDEMAIAQITRRYRAYYDAG